jgi:hypothetical protein
MAFVAIDAGSGDLLGVARLAADPDYTRAEYAIVVRSDLHGRGLGWSLMEHLLAYARSEGLERIEGIVLAENTEMLAMAQELGFSVAPDPGGPERAGSRAPPRHLWPQPASRGGDARPPGAPAGAVQQPAHLGPAGGRRALRPDRPPDRCAGDPGRGRRQCDHRLHSGRPRRRGAGCHPEDDRPAGLARPRRPAHHVPADDIVPGDYVVLEAGDRVPADLRLVRARNLRIDEAILTGESVAVEKATDPVDAEAPLGDRFSAAFSGTFVAAGHGAGVVVATGADTELGRISTLIGSVEQLKTPLIRQMDRFANLLTVVILAISAAVFAFAWGLRGYALPDAFMIVVGLAVAAIPEGLPAVITITLAIGVQRMAARKAIIRRLPAVEALGSVSVICSDKTGTLTRNEMMARTVLGAGTASRSRARVTPRAAASRPTGQSSARSSPARTGPCASSSAAPRCATTPNCARTAKPGSSPATRWKARSSRSP